MSEEALAFDERTRAHWAALLALGSRALLRSEAESKRALQRAVRAANAQVVSEALRVAGVRDTARARRLVTPAVARAARDAAWMLRDAVRAAHSAAASAAVVQHGAEWEYIAWQLKKEGLTAPVLAPRATADAEVLGIRVTQAAEALANAIAQRAMGVAGRWSRTGGGAGELVAELRRGEELSMPAADRTAETESAHVYSESKDMLDASAANDNESAEWTSRAVRVWSAILDRRTCLNCFRRDGEMAPLGQSFAGGEVPPVHPRCRCWAMTLLLPAEAIRRLPGASIDYGMAKRDIAEFFGRLSAGKKESERSVLPVRKGPIGAEGRRHAVEFLRGTATVGSPTTLTRKMLARDYVR